MDPKINTENKETKKKPVKKSSSQKVKDELDTVERMAPDDYESRTKFYGRNDD